MAVDIPNYRIIEKLGVGAQTRLFRARCMRTGGDYTVKIVKIIKPEDASFIDLMRAEHAIGSKVDHPVIRKVYELRLLRQRLRVRGAILFMEYVPGICLADNEYKGSMEETLRIFHEVAQGLSALHFAGYVHADMKPNNILLTPDNTVKLIDLGQSAKIHEAKVKVQGTIDYMAPEQVKRRVLDQRTDVFGFGASLHKVLTGNAIATEMNQIAGMHAENLIGRRVDETRAVSMKQLPVSVTRFVNDCCQHNPDDRIFDMTTVIERLEFVQTIVKRQLAAGTLLTGANVDAPDSSDASDNPDRPDDAVTGSEGTTQDLPE